MGSSKKLKVLVFEDDPSMSNLFGMMLQGCGYDVSIFPDPTACQVYRNQKCDCPMDSPCADAIITDISMPNMTGIELLRLQRKRGCKALDANKALMSAADTPLHREAIEELGCHFFRKPFKMSEIKQWLEECSERSLKGKSLTH